MLAVEFGAIQMQIKITEVRHDGFRQRQLRLLDAFHDAFRQFVAAVVVVVRAVLKRLVQICAERLVKSPAHWVQVNQRAIFLLRHGADGLRIAGQRVRFHASFALHRSD